MKRYLALQKIVEMGSFSKAAETLGHLSMIFNAKWQNFCIRKILMPALV